MSAATTQPTRPRGGDDPNAVPPGCRRTDVRVIPTGWREVTIGHLCNVVRGASPRPINSPVWFHAQSNIGWLRISDITASGKYLYATTQNLSPAGIANSRFVKSGNLVMSICATVGRPVITRRDVCIHDGFVVLENLRTNKEYFYYVLSSIEADWSKHGQTGSQMNLNTGLIKSTLVAFPPLPEQRAIAEALSDVDRLLGALAALIAKKRAIKQAAMQQLLTGKTRLPGFSGEWKVKLLGELEKKGEIKLFRGKVISQKDIERNPGPNPIYSSSVHNNGLFGHYGSYMFEEELITWSVDGGGHFFYRAQHRFSVTNVCGYIRVLSTDLVCRFLAYALQELHRDKVFDYTLKAHPSVIRGQYLIPLPRTEEQTAIATVLSDMDAEITALEHRRDKTKQIKQGMMQQLLTGRVRLVKPAVGS